VLDSGCPPITRRQIFVNGQPVSPPPTDEHSLPMIAPRRTVLDLILVEAAAAAGVHVQEQVKLRSLLYADDTVIGIEGNCRQGSSLQAHAPIVIGADGKRSWVARQVAARYIHYQPPVSLAYFAYWSGCSVEGLHLDFGPGQATGIFPTNDGQTLAFVQCQTSRRAEFQANPLGAYRASLHTVPEVADVLAGATLDSPILGMLDMPAFFRQSYGAGWALVGDAAHHKDPLIARGITDAFRDAEALARGVSAALGGEADLQSELAACQAARDQASREISTLNHRLAELPEEPSEIATRLAQLGLAEASADAGLN
jgi:flavin-dependent dehydrogenase